MQRYRILHRTYYNFSNEVQLEPHRLLLRPRESHELRVESSLLEITPRATLRWHRDVENNSVAIASFKSRSRQLAIISEVTIQQYNEVPFDFLTADYATYFPFEYRDNEKPLLQPYIQVEAGILPAQWLSAIWHPDEPVQTYVLLQRINSLIHNSLTYRLREEPGVQSPEITLQLGTGSCRDFAWLYIAAARALGLAARFVTGYLHSQPSAFNYGSTHAWAEVYLPGAGWKGFDPTTGNIVGTDHIAVAVAISPEKVPPVSGSFIGPPGAVLDVGVWVTKL